MEPCQKLFLVGNAEAFRKLYSYCSMLLMHNMQYPKTTKLFLYAPFLTMKVLVFTPFWILLLLCCADRVTVTDLYVVKMPRSKK